MAAEGGPAGMTGAAVVVLTVALLAGATYLMPSAGVVGGYCGPANGPACDEALMKAQLDDIEEKERKRKKVTIGLALNDQLWRPEARGAITYKLGGWQRAGLTTVPRLLAEMSKSVFFKSFREAATNADEIDFDVSDFSPGKVPGSMTDREFTIVRSTFLSKTTFWENNERVEWNGQRFVRVKQ
jgi:hypothetical protein